MIELRELRELTKKTRKECAISAIWFILRQILEPDVNVFVENETKGKCSFRIIDSFAKNECTVFWDGIFVELILNSKITCAIQFTNDSRSDQRKLLIFFVNNIKKYSFSIFGYNVLTNF